MSLIPKASAGNCQQFVEISFANEAETTGLETSICPLGTDSIISPSSEF